MSIFSGTRMLTMYEGFCPLVNVHFNDMQETGGYIKQTLE